MSSGVAFAFANRRRDGVVSALLALSVARMLLQQRCVQPHMHMHESGPWQCGSALCIGYDTGLANACVAMTVAPEVSTLNINNTLDFESVKCLSSVTAWKPVFCWHIVESRHIVRGF